MITAVTGMRTNGTNFSNLNANFAVHTSKNKTMSNVVNLNQVADSFTKSNQIAFKGNFVKAGKNILTDTGLNSKARRLGEEASGAIGKGIRKLTGGDELPVTDKPITSNIYYNKKMQKELEQKALEDANVKQRKKDAEDAIKANNNTASAGDIDAHGYLTSSGKKKAGLKHHDSGAGPIFGNTGVGSGGNVGSVCDSSSMNRDPHGSMEEYIAYMIQNRIPPYDK